MGQAQFAGEESKDDLKGLIYGTVLRDEELAAIAKGRKVEMKLGDLQFSLDDRSVRLFTEFYSAAKSAS